MDDPNKVTYFAETDARNSRTPFGIKAKDRAKHTYVIGKTGMGKSTLLLNMAIQDVQNGHGVVIIDPHGSFAEELLEFVPEHRVKDVLYFAPFDLEHPISFNVMEDVGFDRRHIVASGLMSAFKKIWQDAWSARMEYILSNTILALLEYPNATLLSVNRMLADKAFREDVVSTVTDPGVKSFWVNEFANYTERFAAEATPAIQNKVGQFTSNPVIRNILGQPKSSFEIRQMMDEGKILIANLSKGRIGEVASTLLGSLFVTKTYLSAMSRADVSPDVLKKLPNCYLYVDEFQTFANESFADILSEARKYKLALTIAHQYVEQMPEEVRSAVFGNVGTMIVFRVGSFDAEVFEKEFAPVFLAQDIVNLGFTQIYLRLMIDGVGSKPFSAKTLPPIAKPPKSFVAEIIESSRRGYARSRVEVENAFVADIEAQAAAAQAEAASKKKPKFGPKPGGPGGAGGFGGDSRPPRRDDGPRGDGQPAPSTFVRIPGPGAIDAPKPFVRVPGPGAIDAPKTGAPRPAAPSFVSAVPGAAPGTVPASREALPPRREETSAPRPEAFAPRPAPVPDRSSARSDEGRSPSRPPAPQQPPRIPREEPRRVTPPVSREEKPVLPVVSPSPLPTPVSAAPAKVPAGKPAIDPASKDEIISFLREIEQEAGVVPVAGNGAARVGSYEARPAKDPEPIHLTELLKKSPAPGHFKKDADEDRKAALRDALAATLGGMKPSAAEPKSPAASPARAPEPNVAVSQKAEGKLANGPLPPRPAPAAPAAAAPSAAFAPRPAPVAPAASLGAEFRPPAPEPVAVTPAPPSPTPQVSAAAGSLAAAVAPLAAAPAAPVRPRPRGIPDDELRAILDAED